MANPTNKSDVFKFVTMRAPVTIGDKKEKQNFIKDGRKLTDTEVGQLLEHLDKNSVSRATGLLKELQKQKKYTLDYPGKDTVLAKVAKFARQQEDPLDANDLRKGIEKILDTSIGNFLNAADTINILNGTWDRYYCFFLLKMNGIYNLEGLAENLRVFHLLDLLNSGWKIDNVAQLNAILSATPVIASPFNLNGNKDEKPSKPEKDKVDRSEPDKKAEKYTRLWTDFIQAHEALNEVKNVQTATPTLKLERQEQVMAGKKESKANGIISALRSETITGKTAFVGLPEKSKLLLDKLNVKEDGFHLQNAELKLTDQLSLLYNQLTSTKDPELLNYLPDEARYLPGISSVVAALEYVPYNTPYSPLITGSSARSLIKPLGIGDLKVVKQKLKKYVSGEVAHIENVLKGESKERKHRVLDRTEDILVVSEENNEETMKDTQTTERFELKKESEKTVEEKMSVQAGVTVSGSYGMVTFGAHADFAFSTSSTESNKSASNFAREVIDKSVSKIQKRTRQERTTKTLHEVEEINTHGLTNVEGTEHITGIYRWVDKYYEAQIYNYGRRMMFEFIIPEPSAFFEFAQNNKPKKNIAAPVPFPTYLSHKDIADWNYQTYIKNYNVQGVTPPPPTSRTISLSMDQSGIDNGRTFSKSSKELVVPEGYTAAAMAFSLSAIYENNPQMKLSVGNDHLWATLTDNDSRRRWDVALPAGFPMNYDSIIPVGVEGYDINSFFINITVICNRTAAKYELWQIQTFEKIMVAYKAMQAEYEQKLSALEAQQGIVIQGQNPGINREIEKTELKKSCIKMLLDTSLYGSFNAMKAGSPPEFDIFDAIDEGGPIQFFEQSFEWENITYLFYPYFWSRKSEWIHKSTTFDTDPLFTKFLQAGSARVVIPVHPSYNDAILHYLETGALWNGGEAPRIDDPLFISIHEELRNQTDDLGNAVAEGDPWEVVLPTTLVYLQEDSELPEYN